MAGASRAESGSAIAASLSRRRTAATSLIDIASTGCIVGERRRSGPAEGKGGCSMLKSIDPMLNADVLYALRSMGHGDDLVIADTNFPSDSVARQTVLGRLLRLDGVPAGRAAKAILSVMPLDSFVEHPALRMEIVGHPDNVPPVQAEVQGERRFYGCFVFKKGVIPPDAA
jgi:L-fucose mutarotase